MFNFASLKFTVDRVNKGRSHLRGFANTFRDLIWGLILSYILESIWKGEPVFDQIRRHHARAHAHGNELNYHYDRWVKNRSYFTFQRITTIKLNKNFIFSTNQRLRKTNEIDLVKKLLPLYLFYAKFIFNFKAGSLTF